MPAIARPGAEAGIVMITVRESEDDKVQALEAGADDFVTKPYRFRELLARVRAVLRRVKAPPAADAPVQRVGELELDLDRRELRKAGAQIHLSPTEFELMAFFFQHQGVPVTHAKLLRAIWGPEYGNEVEYLRSYVRMLRKKVEEKPAQPEYILTEPWVGYRFRNPSDAGNMKPRFYAFFAASPMTIECMRGSVGVFLAATLLAAAVAQTEGSEVKTYRDWKRLRAQARTAGDFHKLDAWCEKQAELYQKRAAGYEAELHDYYRNPSEQARPVPQDPSLRTELKDTDPRLSRCSAT